MQSIGIICEFNPFHNGHHYFINAIKKAYPNHLLILILNGYFLERGEPSIISKKDKTRLSLYYGIDIVLELPFVYGTQSADVFAEASLKILNEFQIEKLIFGSETNNKEILIKIANYQLNNQTFNNDVRLNLKTGINYPTAIAKALNLKDFSFMPNDLLGISYTKAIIKNNFKIDIETIKRTNNFHDNLSDNYIISASNIRLKIKEKQNINKYVPNKTLKYIGKIDEEKLFSLLKYKIIASNNLSDYLDVDEGIEYRLKSIINDAQNYQDLIQKIKTKRYTYNRINRMLVHILIGFTKQDNNIIELDYIKILGFNEKGKNYLNKIKKEINIPLITNKSSLIYNYELKSALIYDLITNSDTFNFEKFNKPVYFE